MVKACLIIIFNHRFDRNIPVLEKLYSSRFSNIFFLVPFYDGNNPRVIPVYESSYYFQSFVAQGFHRFYSEEFSHYIFAGDDCLLNPALNENNFLELSGIPEGSDFIPEFIQFHKLKEGGWWHTKKAIEFFSNRPGAEIRNELPSKEEAIKRFHQHGLSYEPLTVANIFGKKKIQFLNWWQSRLYKQFYLRVKWKSYRKNGKYELPYPAVGSYSDIFMATKESVRQFSRYCGILASAGLFVEIAVPTSMVLASKKITMEKDMKMKGKAIWDAGENTALEEANNRSLSSLMKNFPPGQLYYHPVKLSKWNNDL